MAFSSNASNLIAGGTSGQNNIFVKNLVTGTVTLASADAAGTPASGFSTQPSISADGQTVAFISNAFDLVAGDTNGAFDVFIKDLTTGDIVRASLASDGSQSNGDSYQPALRPDGRQVAFTSSASNLIANDLNARTDVFLASIVSNPPQIELGPDLSLGSGQTLAVMGSFTDFDGTLWKAAVDYGDGSGAQPLTLSADKSFQLQHNYTSAGLYTVTVTITSDGGSDGIGTLYVAVGLPPSVNLGGSETLPEGSLFASQGRWSGGGSLPLTAIINYGDGTALEPQALNADGTFALDHVYENAGNYTLSATLLSGSSAIGVGTTSICVSDVPPLAVILGVLDTSSVRMPISMTASATDPSPVETAAGFTYAWTVTENGHVSVQGSGPSFQFTPEDIATYVVTLTATAQDGVSGSASDTISVIAAPQPSISGAPVTTAAGTPIVLTASASDSSPTDTAAGFTYAWTVTSGGQLFNTGMGASFRFTSDESGTYVVTLTATAQSGAVGITSATINVYQVSPIPMIDGAPASSPAGTPISLTAISLDPGPQNSVGADSYAWTVTANGNPYAAGTGPSLQFTPGAYGIYIVTLTAAAQGGSTGTTSQTVVVPDPVLQPSIGGVPNSSPAGMPITMTASDTDPITGNTTGFTFTWNVARDGSPYTSGSGTSFTWTPDREGSYSALITAVTQDGRVGAATESIAVTFTGASPIIHGLPASSPAWSPLTLTATAIDPTPVLETAFTVFWWSIYHFLPGGGESYALSGSSIQFTPEDAGSYLISVEAIGYDNEMRRYSEDVYQYFTVTAPVTQPSINGAPATSSMGSQISLSAFATDPSPLDTVAGYAYAWSITDNGQPYLTNTGASLQFTPSHAGNYVVTLVATAQDGGVGTTTTTINVQKAAPVITWANPADIIYGTALGAAQLDASTSVTGTWVYTPAAGTVLGVGAGQALSVTFTPTDTADYTSVTQTVFINVRKAVPVITWANPGGYHLRHALGRKPARCQHHGGRNLALYAGGRNCLETRRGPDTVGDIHAERHHRLHVSEPDRVHQRAEDHTGDRLGQPRGHHLWHGTGRSAARCQHQRARYLGLHARGWGSTQCGRGADSIGDVHADGYDRLQLGDPDSAHQRAESHAGDHLGQPWRYHLRHALGRKPARCQHHGGRNLALYAGGRNCLEIRRGPDTVGDVHADRHHRLHVSEPDSVRQRAEDHTGDRLGQPRGHHLWHGTGRSAARCQHQRARYLGLHARGRHRSQCLCGSDFVRDLHADRYHQLQQGHRIHHQNQRGAGTADHHGQRHRHDAGRDSPVAYSKLQRVRER